LGAVKNGESRADDIRKQAASEAKLIDKSITFLEAVVCFDFPPACLPAVFVGEFLAKPAAEEAVMKEMNEKLNVLSDMQLRCGCSVNDGLRVRTINVYSK